MAWPRRARASILVTLARIASIAGIVRKRAENAVSVSELPYLASAGVRYESHETFVAVLLGSAAGLPHGSFNHGHCISSAYIS
jgi:hypothetical protein